MYKHIKNILITWLLVLSVGAFASTEITLNSTVDGALTEDSYIDADGNRAEYYTFTLSEAKNIVLNLDAAFTGYLKLKDAQGTTLNSTVFGSHYINKELIGFSKYLEAGTYTIKVQNKYSSDFGTFTLTYKKNQPKHIQPISLGQTLNGSFTESTYIGTDGRRAEYYSFTLDEAQDIRVDFRVDSNYARVAIKDAQGKIIRSRYDALSQYLEAGDYIIKVSSYSLANFTLSMNINKKHIQPISLGETKSVQLTENSYLGEYDRAEYYSFTLTSAQNIAFHYDNIIVGSYGTGGGFRPSSYMILEDSQGEYIERTDFGSNHFSRYLEAGEYRIKIQYDGFVNFTLTINTNNKDTQPISLDETLTREFTNNSYIDNHNYRAEYYSFTLTKSKDIVIQSHANFRTVIDLKDAQGNIIVSDSGSGSGHNALIATHLEAGNYSIKIRPDYEERLGEFTLSLNENSIEEQSITLDTLVADRLIIDSGISPQSSNYTKYYTFTLAQATSIDMVLKSSDFLVKLYLLDSNNKLIVGSPNDYNHSTYSETINHNLEAGTYTVAVSTKYSDKVGAFTLEIKDLGKYTWLIPAVYTPILLN